MKKIFDKYGIKSDDTEKLSKDVEAILGIKFELRYSDFKGDYYLYKDSNGQRIELTYNYNHYEQDWFEPQFALYTNLLHIHDTLRSSLIEQLLIEHFGDRAVLIERKVLEEKD